MNLKGKRFVTIVLMFVMVLGMSPVMDRTIVVNAEVPLYYSNGNPDESDTPELSSDDATNGEENKADPEVTKDTPETDSDPQQEGKESFENKEPENETPAETYHEETDPDKTTLTESQESPESSFSEGSEAVDSTSKKVFRAAPAATALKENESDEETGTNHNGEHTHTDASGNVIIFKEWNYTDHLPNEPGSYYLKANVNLAEGWKVPDGIFNLCLNGYTISAPAPVGVIHIRNAGKTVNLFDEWENNGKIMNTRNDTNHTCGGVYILNGEVNMYGGTITGGGGKYAGGVYVENGIFRMYGGEISGNSSAYAGGVYLQNSTFSMNGGKISGNTGEIAGGVLITRTAVTVSGNPIVKDNHLTNTSASNVYLYDSSKITLTGALSGDASIGISMEKPGMFTRSTADIKAKAYDSYFSSDDHNYAVLPIGGDLRLAKKKINSDLVDSVPADVFANNQLYDGTAKPLVTSKGNAVGGTMYYAVGTDVETAPDTGWDTGIPTAVEEGTYYVWYMAAGDESHNDSVPAVVTATISKNAASVSETTDTVVTCQMAGYPADYAWNESAKACQPGYLDANGVFHSNRKAIPNTSDTGLVWYAFLNISSLVVMFLCSITLMNSR